MQSLAGSVSRPAAQWPLSLYRRPRARHPSLPLRDYRPQLEEGKPSLSDVTSQATNGPLPRERKPSSYSSGAACTKLPTHGIGREQPRCVCDIKSRKCEFTHQLEEKRRIRD